MPNVLNNDKGFSIIEVLIGATVFMLGFGVLVLMLNNVFLKFSVRELELANNLGQQLMTETLVAGDTTSLDTTIEYSGLRMVVVRDVSTDNDRLSVDLAISRESSGKELIHLYNEIFIPDK
ncbi:MAG: prepilin-type N-terminal cleavage/methylation domain-containing protein [Candidatus Zixiibacteriota bacterium]